jgi:xanthine dehydrogenase YagR molybdenum-binding subunit
MSERKVTLGFPGNTKELTVDVADDSPPIWGVDAQLKVVGTDVPRLDGVEKVTGRAKYAYDINLPGMLHGRILRSTFPAATITAIDTADAMKMPGVKGLVYAFDEAQIGKKAMRFAGEEILAIAADTAEHAEDAIRAVRVEYEPEEFVVDTEDARKEGAPVVHPDVANNVKKGRTRGDLGKIEEKLQGAAKVIEATYRTQVQTHSCLETHGVTVKPEADGSLTVWASTQGVFSVRDGLAENLKMKPDQIRVITHYMGGGFGSKFGPRTEGVLAAKLALQTKAPVKLMLNRKEEQLATGNRPNSVQHVRLGADQNGKLVAIAVNTYGTGGVGGGAGCAIPIVYKFPEDSVYKEEADVLTNAGPATAMRAPGHPQGVFAMEQAMDELAHALDMDPLQFRKLNDESPIRAAEYDIGAKEIGWDRRNKTPGEGALIGSKRRGIGMASTQWGQAGGKTAHADVEIHKSGDVILLQGAQDLGTGFRTAMAIIVAEELGLRPTDVQTKVGESAFGFGPGSGGSTTTPTVAPAVHAAAFNAKCKLQEAVASQWGVAAADIKFADGKVSAGEKTMSFKQACALLPADKITAGGDRTENYEGYQNSVAGVQFAEVEVDVETGEVRVTKVVAVQDAGRTLNKMAAESQISGSVIQSVSFALFEDRIMDKQVGHMVNPNLMEYKIAGPADTPEIVPIVFQVANGKNSVGAMGLGEPPAIPLPAAIANAVYNAIGVRMREMPITPDRVLAALGNKRAEATA